MAPQFDTPGVFIQEVTGPGVIAGVGTSTAAFIGPALRGPINEPRFITSFDDFLRDYAITLADGSQSPFITDPRHFYLAHAVRGFYENGGRFAYIVRVGTARRAAWDVPNRATPAEVAFHVEAREEGAAGDAIGVEIGPATMASGVTVITGSATINAVTNNRITVDDATPFQPGDVVTHNGTARATISQINGNELVLSNTLAGAAAPGNIRIADLQHGQTSFRVSDAGGLRRGGVIHISGDEPTDLTVTNEEFAVVDRVNDNIVTLTRGLENGYSLNAGAADFDPVTINSQEFTLIIHPPDGSADELFENLSLSTLHPNYVFNVVDSAWVRVRPPAEPPTANLPGRLVNTTVGILPLAVTGQDDDPTALTADEYREGLDALRNVDDVNFITIPDAATHTDRVTIQQALITHCLQLGDRFALIDSWLGVPPSGSNSILDQRAAVGSERGFAALYYPWLEIRDPTTRNGRRLLIPPSGHVAGVFARVDQQRGVHKAPANEVLRSVLGLERTLTDEQQAPLNREGVNALRIFPGQARPIIWGARTTVDPAVTDWIYVNVRRLMLFIEESIEEGIRFAVFEPNNLALWQKLKRTITEFLTRVWRGGALFGATPEEAFYVRIDEALNPPATRALGQLFIEIGVAPVRPAEFIIVRIGLSEGETEVSET